MNFKIITQDGPGRFGAFKINNKKINTPNILFLDSKRFQSPDFSDIILSNVKKDKEKLIIEYLKDSYLKKDFTVEENNLDKIDDTCIFVLKYANQIFRKSKKFTDKIIETREKIGYENIVYTPAIANPVNISLLTYMGIDLFDSTNAIINARKKTMFFKNGNKKIYDLKENPCTCPICINSNKKPKDMNFEEILNHNYYMLFSEIKNIRNSISNNTLRDLVEKRVKSRPHLTSILRILDQNFYKFLEEKTPLIENNTLYATTFESMNRPEIKRFQYRALNRYKKPDSAKILLLLPCSAKKPYSFSKSHSFFRRTIQSTNNPNAIHELIVTSPVGIVPRELELIYPAGNYDIPVTGVWNEDEKHMIKNLLKKYIQKNKYDFVISHLKKDMNDFIKDAIKINEKTCVDHPTSNKSLEKLKDVLNKASLKYKKVKKPDRAKENILSFASYQFGKKIAENMLKDARIKGRYPYQKIIKDNKQIGMLVKEKGSISLTLEGAEILYKEKANIVNIADDFILKGSVFAPGIIDADEDIRIGDEVIVLKKNKLVAVGSALLNGKSMKELHFGEAVKVRHIKKI